MTYEQYQFILRLSKMVEDYQKEFKDFKLRLEEHLKSDQVEIKSGNKELPNFDLDLLKSITKSENKISIEMGRQMNPADVMVLSKSIMEAITKLCDFVGVKKIEVVYQKSEK